MKLMCVGGSLHLKFIGTGRGSTFVWHEFPSMPVPTAPFYANPPKDTLPFKPHIYSLSRFYIGNASIDYYEWEKVSRHDIDEAFAEAVLEGLKVLAQRQPTTIA